MCRGTRKPRELKVRRYAECMVDLNGYLDILTGPKASKEIGETKLDKTIFHSMPNGCSRQVYR